MEISREVVNTVGLFLDAVGVIIVFWFAWPQPDLSDKVYLTTEEDASNDPGHQAIKSRHKMIAVGGLIALVSGFGLQIVATWM